MINITINFLDIFFVLRNPIRHWPIKYSHVHVVFSSLSVCSEQNMDQREYRSYVGILHFNPGKNIMNGVDLYKNGRFVNQIKQKIDKEMSSEISRVRTMSIGSGEPAPPPTGSSSVISQSSSTTSLPY